ncbi:serine--tRNA ligase, partial [Candidatus Woesebacteria bacterium]
MIWGYNDSMIDINYIRENPEKIKKGIKSKQLDPKLVDEALELDKKRRELLNKIETLRAERNKAAKEQDKEKGGEIKTKLQKLEPELAKIEKEYKEKLYQIPNLPADDVKVGRGESENEVIKKWGEKKESPAKDYLELGEDLDIIDIKRAAKVSGSRFGYLKGDA